jgi:xanthine dehydrogenase YagT iron-sulfur-binding subunit
LPDIHRSQPIESNQASVTFTLNGVRQSLAVEPRRTLLDTLRTTLNLTGTKKVCDMGNCAACTVLVDGHAMYACLLLAIDCEHREIITIAGWLGPKLDPAQCAFIEHDAFQCGFCTPGQIMSLRGLLNDVPDPTDKEIERAVSGNICR